MAPPVLLFILILTERSRENWYYITSDNSVQYHSSGFVCLSQKALLTALFPPPPFGTLSKLHKGGETSPSNPIYTSLYDEGGLLKIVDLQAHNTSQRALRLAICKRHRTTKHKSGISQVKNLTFLLLSVGPKWIYNWLTNYLNMSACVLTRSELCLCLFVSLNVCHLVLLYCTVLQYFILSDRHRQYVNAWVFTTRMRISHVQVLKRKNPSPVLAFELGSTLIESKWTNEKTKNWKSLKSRNLL